MAGAITGDDIARSISASLSGRNGGEYEAFDWSGRRREEEEEELRWAAIERLPTYDRMRKGILKQVGQNGEDDTKINEIDVRKLGVQEKKMLMGRLLKDGADDNEKFLLRLRQRIDRVGLEIPKIEVRYENLSVEGDVHVGSRALPTLLNATLNSIESVLGLIGLSSSKKRRIQILQDMSGIVKPSRMTLLLGPPGAGKTTMLLALAGKLDENLKSNGKITYCGHEMHEFIPRRTCAYISQHDIHYGEMTARETFDFSGCCLGVGSRYEMLTELSRRERDAKVKPEADIDVVMKATSLSGQKASFATDYILQMLGLDICADTVVGDEMRRGISGGQKKRVTTGEMIVGPANVFLMDEISTGLDSSTTFQICRFMRQMVHIFDVTMIISLLQPAPETFELFDDVILLSDGQIVYQGKSENVLEFFEHMGFKCPKRKGVADFLQEVTSKRDQAQYWCKEQPYTFVSVQEFVQGFRSFHIGQQLEYDLRLRYDKSKAHPNALVTNKYGISSWELFKTCFSRECLLMKRNSFLYVFKTMEIAIMSIIAFTVFLRTEMKVGTIEDGQKFHGALFFSLINIMFNGLAELSMTIVRLPVFFKQRDFLFYPAWAFALPIWAISFPLSLMESGIWVCSTYYTIGFAPSPSRFFKQFLAFVGVHQMALPLFRFIAVVGRTQVVANTLGFFTLLLVFVLGGFVIDRNDIAPWMIWGYYASPMMYGQNAIVINEFLDKRWSVPNPDPRIDAPTVGKVLLKSRGFFTEDYWFWICIGALFGFSILFNLLYIVALTFLHPFGDSKTVVVDEDKKEDSFLGKHQKKDNSDAATTLVKRGMVLPFQPLSLVFNHVNYYVDMPTKMKMEGQQMRLQLLRDISGSFRPGILTALMGVSGAGKTTLMDVLAGRKTVGCIEGDINISGYPKRQETFARVSGYCEQIDIHSPHVTVHESLLYSAWLRLSKDVDTKTRKMFVEEIMELVELNPIRDALVGLPGVDGLSTEQRKRLTIAVELVANPSIIFMDEPTSGLDARAAAIVMRTVRNTVDTGRTVVCTIHQPSIDIFEAFDELLLMKRGGQVIYGGALGYQSHKLIEYFQAVPGVPQIKEGYNPATWMLEVSNSSMEAQLNVDFAELYANSSLNKMNRELADQLSSPPPGSKDLHFPTKYSQPFFVQCKACFWKQHRSYWRNPQYNAIRFFMTIVIGILFGLIFWKKGQKMTKQQDLLNLLGAIYSAVFFLGTCNISTVQPIVNSERTVFYREKASGMYSALPYAFAQMAVETIYIAIQSITYTLILFPMIGFEWTAVKFFWFLYFVFTCFLYCTLLGMMLVALTPNHQLASIVAAFFISLWDVFTGFVIPRMEIPIWWRWGYWVCPVAWTIYGLVESQVGDKKAIVEVPGAGNVPLDLFLKESFGYNHDFLPAIAFAHLGWVLFFFFGFACGIKFINFQKR